MMYGWMDGSDGSVDGWIDGWMVDFMDGMNGWDGWMDVMLWLDGWIEERMNFCDGWAWVVMAKWLGCRTSNAKIVGSTPVPPGWWGEKMDGWMDGWMDEWM